MHRRAFASNGLRPTLVGSACLLTTLPAMLMPTTAAAQGQTGGESSVLEEVTVTGYRRSLEDSATAKRESTNFTDSVFAEDIGKFPDLNIAESLNRIPGIQLTREINGDGLNIAIRGLGTEFTKVVMNGTQIAVASTGRTDSQNSNRELDLDLFPTELFTRLDVNKTPRAGLLEGGVSGTVNMRTARPFDNPGLQFSYQLQTGYGEESDAFSPRGAAIASWTNETFGVLAGVAGVHNKSTTEGFETIGYANMRVSNALCGIGGTPAGATDQPCNTSGGEGRGWTPGITNSTTGLSTVPAGAGAGLVQGTVMDRAFFESRNPGLTLEQISNAVIPRLGRPSYSDGTRDRVSAVLSFEYRPLDNLNFYLDTLYADANREFDRLDVNFVGRAGAAIPLNMKVDENGVVTRATFANAQFFLEGRPYDEEVDFYNLNPGVHFEPLEWLGVDFQLNKTRSNFFRESPTVLVNTPAESNHVVEYVNEGGDFPTFTSQRFDLNDPNLGWTWIGGRVNLQAERRVTETEGAHLDARIGSDDLNVIVGGAWDDISRRITALDGSREWQQRVCGGGGAFIDQPLPAPQCRGQAGSAVTDAGLASYLSPGPGFITVDFDRFFADTGYHEILARAPVAQQANTQAPSGYIQEKTTGAYVEFNGRRELWGHMLRLNGGARYVQTDQIIQGPFILGGVVQQGPWQELLSDYNKVLPSFNAAFNVTDNIVARAAASRTLTRPNPSFMLPATTFTDISASRANQGNPTLKPFISDNLDLGGEWYTGDEGFIGLNVFQKKINNFTQQGSRRIPFRELNFPYEQLNPDQQRGIDSRGGQDVATVEVVQQVNTPDTLRIRGYEIVWVQPLRQWVPALDGFGVNANYTRVMQKSLGLGVPQFAQGVSPHTYNVTGYFEKGPASIRLSWVWNDEQFSSGFNEDSVPTARRITEAYGQLDLSASYEFTSLPTSPQITLNALNITGEKQVQNWTYENAPWTFYDPGFQILLGIRGKF
jgi:TonB-dependent receptor